MVALGCSIKSNEIFNHFLSLLKLNLNYKLAQHCFEPINKEIIKFISGEY